MGVDDAVSTKSFLLHNFRLKKKTTETPEFWRLFDILASLNGVYDISSSDLARIMYIINITITRLNMSMYILLQMLLYRGCYVGFLNMYVGVLKKRAFQMKLCITLLSVKIMLISQGLLGVVGFKN